MDGTTQGALERKSGVDRSDLSSYKTGQKPDYINLVKFCTALNLSPTWLIFGRGSKLLSDIRVDVNDPAQELNSPITAEVIEIVKAAREGTGGNAKRPAGGSPTGRSSGVSARRDAGKGARSK